MEPIFLKPIYKHVIWGGNNISRILERDVVGDDIGESWEISTHPGRESIIENIDSKEKDLSELFNDKEKRKAIFGSHCEGLDRFPILVKFIDANDNLSIQVHPNDEYAIKNEHDVGKDEVWYVVDCEENAQIIYGFKENITYENLKDSIDNNIENSVEYLNVQKGDVIVIPSGVVHAIMKGVFICEVQQNSDITYRVYDWDRIDKDGKPRILHKEKALDVIRLDKENKIDNYIDLKEDKNIYNSDKFNIDIVTICGDKEYISNNESFYAYIVIEGSGKLQTDNFSKNISKGDSFIIPATLGKYSFCGNLKLIKSWI